MDIRNLNPQDALALRAGERHYRAFVGPAYRYDLIGASQFSLLTMLGMREQHRLLDFGCGSLRLGRLAIPYLREGCYFGVEPEAWLVDDGFTRELGEDARTLKKPRFDHNAEYRTDVFGETFDFIIAQSIFSHTGEAASVKALTSFAGTLAPHGLILGNWLIGDEDPNATPEACDWVYPECVIFAQTRVEKLAKDAGLSVRLCPWPHTGGLTWFAMAHEEADLPSEADMERLRVAPLERPA